MPESKPRDLKDIYGRPGFKLRRAHQIAQAIFMEECKAFDLTPTQYGVLFVLSLRPGLDQISLARLLGLDRSTTGMVVGILAARDLVRRTVDPRDKRKRTLAVTAAAAKLIDEVQPALRRAQERLLAPFAPTERQTLLDLLDRLLEIGTSETRAPLRPRLKRAAND
ncbi:MAG TPA: MarR family transcriptional regulator [Alphaproteobacteria bacterium]|nr:MarR family transcriptional regulator [Alphaproteobacteria bacterium]